MSYKRRLNQYEKGYIACLGSLVRGWGVSTEALELYRDIGSPSPDMAQRSGLSVHDVETIKKLHEAANAK